MAANADTSLNQKKWRSHDPILFDALELAHRQGTILSLADIANSGLIPNALHFRDLLSDNAAERVSYIKRAKVALSQAPLIFFDPDNGVERSKKRGQRGSSKYIYKTELSDFFNSGHSILIYQHFPRENRKTFTIRLSTDLLESMPGSTITTFQSANVAFFLVMHPAHQAMLKGFSEPVATPIA